MDYPAYTQNPQQQQRAHDPNQQASYANCSQMQSYEESTTTQSYYQYPYTADPYQQQQQQQQQYSSYVYPQGYTDYNHQQPQPPGVPANTHLHTQQDYYYPLEYYTGKQNSGLGSNPPAAGGSNPVNVNVSHQPHQPVGHFPYRGKGRRGGRPFRGAARGSFAHTGAWHQSRGGHFSPHGAASIALKAAITDVSGGTIQPSSISATGQAPGLMPSQQAAAPPQASRLAWCDLCRVECNTELILEQHKNGKRHKKNLKVQAELQTIKKKINESNVPMPLSETLSKAERTEEIQTQLKDLPSEAVDGENEKNDESERDAGKKIEAAIAEPALEAGQESKEHLETQLPSKRKMKGGRGGKYIRTNAGLRQAVEQSAVPFFCELCNVKCESQAVIDSHFAGKKHQSNLKRGHGHLALHGNPGFQALYPSIVNSASTSIAPQAVQQGVSDPQVLLAQVIMNYVLSQTQGAHPVIPHGPAPDFASSQASMSSSGLAIHPQEGSQVQGLQSASEAGIVSFATSKPQSGASIDTPACHVTGTGTGTETSIVEAEEKTVYGSDVMQSDNSDAGVEQVPSAASTSLSVAAVDVPAREESNVPRLLQDAQLHDN